MVNDIIREKDVSKDIPVTPAMNGENVSPDPAPREAQVSTPDTLTHCLLHIARHHGRPISREALLAGIPLANEGRLTPLLVPQAAERAGLNVRAVRQTLEHIKAEVLPAILLLKDESACVLVSRESDGKMAVVFPDVCDGVREYAPGDLQELYGGFVIYALPSTRSGVETRPGDSAPSGGHWFWGAFREQWWSYAQVMIAAFMLNCFALASPLFVMNVYDRVVPNNAMESLWVLSIGVALVFCFDFLIKTLRGLFIDRSGKKVDILLENRLFVRMLGMRLRDRPASSGYFANIIREMEMVRDFFTSATLTSFIDLPFIFIFIALFWYIGGPIAFVFMAVLPLVVAMGFLIHFPLRKSVCRSLESAHEKHAILVEALSNIETVKAVGCESALRKKWGESAHLGAGHAVRSRSLSHLTMNITGLLQQFAYVVIIIVGVYLISEGEMTTGGLIACSILSGRVMTPFAQIAQLITRLQHAVTSYKRLDEVMRMPEERPMGKRFVQRNLHGGEIEFRDVEFSYPNASTPVLSTFNLKIAENEKVGILGRTGSGKSTLGKLILNLYTPDRGAVLIDGTDMQQLDPVDIRRAIGFVPQDVTLFQGSIRDNICMGYPQATDQQILNAAFISGTHDFVRLHPQGYDLPVGERGCNLSGGQKQSVSIARALLHNPKILVLDEPTSSLDNRAEELFMKRLKLVLKDKTLILITHKSSLLALVDRLVVIDEGRIVENGPRDVVLEKLMQGAIKRAGREQ
jgi:ATP-binding cassette subfamily C protein LapB